MSTFTELDSPKQIEAILDEIRPAIRADGGDIELISFDRETGRVGVRLVGACYDCPMSADTLRFGVEQQLRQAIHNVHSVEIVE
ncbi:MAG: NifU family protein [Gemmatimonadetes bacterium]|nr:NifU family protein [Gemmatimonadota bacterium]